MMRYLLLACIAGVISTSCLTTTPEINVPKRVVLFYSVSDLGKMFEVNSDSISVDEFKFIVSMFELITQDSTLLQAGDDLGSLVFSYNHEMTQERLILSLPLQFQGMDRFEGYTMFVDQAKTSDNIPNDDFYESDRNYSIVASGTFNGEEFIYRSDSDFINNYELGLIELDSSNPFLTIRKYLDVETIFRDPETGDLLNPNQPINHARIDSLFKNNLRIEAGAEPIDNIM